MPDGFPVFFVVFEPKLRGDAIPVEMFHHRHHELPGTDREVDRVNNLQHDFQQFGSVPSGGVEDRA